MPQDRRSYNNSVEVQFDPAKDVINRAKHGISLARAGDLVIDAVVEDDRFAEPRVRLYGWLDGEPHCLAAVLSDGIVRAISLRRAHQKEYCRHVR